jgi:hypothetical protein
MLCYLYQRLAIPLAADEIAGIVADVDRAAKIHY